MHMFFLPMIIFVFIGIVIFLVVFGILVTAILRAVSVSRGNAYRSGYVGDDSTPSVDPGSFDIIDTGPDFDRGSDGAAIDIGYTQPDASNMSQPGFDSGPMDQQGADPGAFGSSGADTSSSGGWDSGPTDSGMSGGGMDSSSSGM